MCAVRPTRASCRRTKRPTRAALGVLLRVKWAAVTGVPLAAPSMQSRSVLLAAASRPKRQSHPGSGFCAVASLTATGSSKPSPRR
jgi:hypothetical protein